MDKAISDATENKLGAMYLRNENQMEREGGKKKKKRKMSSPSLSEDGESQSMSDTESVGDNV